MGNNYAHFKDEEAAVQREALKDWTHKFSLQVMKVGLDPRYADF